MTEGCPERLDWEFTKYVWDFQRDQRPLLLEKLAPFKDKKTIHMVNSRKGAETLLNSILEENIK